MTYCRVCRKFFNHHRKEWEIYDGPFGYVVQAKVGMNSFRCCCIRCGHTWRANSRDAAFQFNQPQKYKQRQDIVDKLHRKFMEELRQGITYSCKTKQKTFERNLWNI